MKTDKFDNEWVLKYLRIYGEISVEKKTETQRFRSLLKTMESEGVIKQVHVNEQFLFYQTI
jgi:hypothetical protein